MIFITGSNGFVASHLINKLDSSKLVLLGRNNKADCFKFTDQDISASESYYNVLAGVSCIIHCVARVHVMKKEALDSLDIYRQVNTEGTLNLAKQAARLGVKRFIFISSIKVNGESTSKKLPFTSFDTHLPQDHYGISKSEAEGKLMALGKETGMEIVIIRPPLVYGQGVKANFASLMKLVNKGIPLPFSAINRNKRSLVSVYNLVDLIKVCIDHPKAANQVFLVSDDSDLSTAEMVGLMAKVQNKNNLGLYIPIWCLKLIGKLLNKNDVVDRLTGSLQLDITHTKETLNWHPSYSVEYGFKKAAESDSTEKI